MKLNVNIKILTILLTLLLIGFYSTGCIRTYTDELNDDHSLIETTETIDYENLDSLYVDLKMGVGKLNVSGGIKDIFKGCFIYSIDRWKPNINYSSTGKKGQLFIEQPSNTKKINIGKKQKYQWDISLSEEIPMDLSIKLGVGSSILAFDTINLRNLDIEMGVGETEIDLRGDWEEDVNISIEGGVGSATIVLPKNIGVIIEVDGGIGTINADGLISNGNVYTNELYNDSPPKLTIDIEAGIGEITFK